MNDEAPGAALRRSARESEAFVAFYDAYFERILAFMVRRVYDAAVALDLTAETFAQAYVGRSRYRGSTEGQAAAWVYRIAKRQVARYFRKGRAERRALARLGIQTPPLDRTQEAQIEEFAELHSLRETLRTELERLAPAHREALRLRVVDELSYGEVAARLGVSEQAARARVSRALKALAATLDQSPNAKERLA